jgi:uncharacterized membrane protein
MKSLIAAVALAFATGVMAQPAKAPEPKAEAVQNDKCVKKDKNGKCPPLPKGEKPTPKKKAEAK